MRPVVYIAGPLSGEMLPNTLRAVEVADRLLGHGIAPLVPHLSLFWHYHRPHEYEAWMALDFALLAKCDALLRMDGASPGADREVEEAEKLGIPVFLGEGALLRWVDTRTGRVA